MADTVYISNQIQPVGFALKDLVPVVALLFSLVSLLVSLYGIFLGKTIDFALAKYNKLCIEYVGHLFEPVETIFNLQQTSLLGYYKNEVTTFSTNLQLYITELKNINYPQIEIEKIIEVLETFTDDFYEQVPEKKVSEFKAEYINMKLKIHELMYEYALNKELNILQRLFFRAK